jgi:hypothetical protein
MNTTLSKSLTLTLFGYWRRSDFSTKIWSISQYLDPAGSPNPREAGKYPGPFPLCCSIVILVRIAPTMSSWAVKSVPALGERGSGDGVGPARSAARQQKERGREENQDTKDARSAMGFPGTAASMGYRGSQDQDLHTWAHMSEVLLHVYSDLDNGRVMVS